MSPAVEATLDRLEETRQRWWVFSLLCNVLLVLLVSLGTLVLCILADSWLRLSQPWLVLLFGIWIVQSVILLIGTAYRLFRFQRTVEATARRIELSFPELGSYLINLIQLSNAPAQSYSGFREAALAEAAESDRAATAQWNEQTEDFTPRHTHFTPRWGRVMLYAYWPAGAVDWDDIVVKQIKPPPANATDKIRRPSLETKVTSEELEQGQKK